MHGAWFGVRGIPPQPPRKRGGSEDAPVGFSAKMASADALQFPPARNTQDEGTRCSLLSSQIPPACGGAGGGRVQQTLVTKRFTALASALWFSHSRVENGKEQRRKVA
jgi:hypothetical protein